MADTVVNKTPSERSSAGWIVAVIVLLAVLILGYFAFARTGTAPTTDSDNLDVNVTVPGVGDGSAPGDSNLDSSGEGSVGY